MVFQMAARWHDAPRGGSFFFGRARGWAFGALARALSCGRRMSSEHRATMGKLASILGALGLLGGAGLTAGAGCGTAVDPGTPEFTACTGPGQCELAAKTCCGTCGVPTLADLTGVNREKRPALQQELCSEDPGPCPDCAEGIAPNLAAFCVEGTANADPRPTLKSTCAAIDVRTDAVSACATDADCRLRYTGCCEACGEVPELLLAVSQTGAADYQKQVCAPDIVCGKCAVQYPAGFKAVCNASTKHCEVASSP